MKLSSRSRYGLRALVDIALHDDGRPLALKDVAERQAIPPRFLEQILLDLRRAGLLEAKRGPRGGYRLARPADEIRLRDALLALEGPVTLRTPADDRSPRGEAGPAVDAVLGDLERAIVRTLDGPSLGDVLRRAEELGLRGRPPRKYVYVI